MYCEVEMRIFHLYLVWCVKTSKAWFRKTSEDSTTRPAVERPSPVEVVKNVTRDPRSATFNSETSIQRVGRQIFEHVSRLGCFC